MICVTFDPTNKLLPVPTFVTNGSLWQHTAANFSLVPSQETPVTGCVTHLPNVAGSLVSAGKKLHHQANPQGGDARVGETARIKTRRAEAKAERTQHRDGVRRKRNEGALRWVRSRVSFPATLFCKLKNLNRMQRSPQLNTALAYSTETEHFHQPVPAVISLVTLILLSYTAVAQGQISLDL